MEYNYLYLFIFDLQIYPASKDATLVENLCMKL